MQTQQALPTGTHPHSIPEAPEAPGALSPDLQKVKLGFQPSRHFNDFAQEPKERREAERSSTSCLVTGGGGGTRDEETGFYFILFLTRPFLHFQETQIPPVASAAPDPVQMAGRNPASSTTELLDEPTSKKGSQAAGKGATQAGEAYQERRELLTSQEAPSHSKFGLSSQAGQEAGALRCPPPALTFPSQQCVCGDEPRAHIHSPKNVKPWQPALELGELLGALGAAKPGCN